MPTEDAINGDDSVFLDTDWRRVEYWYLHQSYTSLRRNVLNTLTYVCILMVFYKHMAETGTLQVNFISIPPALGASVAFYQTNDPHIIRPVIVWLYGLMLTVSAAFIAAMMLLWFNMYQVFYGTYTQDRLSSAQMRAIALRQGRIPEAISTASAMLIAGILVSLLGFIDLIWNTTVATRLGILVYPLIALLSISAIFSALYIAPKIFPAAQICPWPVVHPSVPGCQCRLSPDRKGA